MTRDTLIDLLLVPLLGYGAVCWIALLC